MPNPYHLPGSTLSADSPVAGCLVGITGYQTLWLFEVKECHVLKWRIWPMVCTSQRNDKYWQIYRVQRKKKDWQFLKSFRIHVSDNGWRSEGSETGGHVGSRAFVYYILTDKMKLRKVLCTCIQRETMVRALRMETRLTQLQQYTEVSVALELQKDLEISCHYYYFRRMREGMANASLRSILREVIMQN